MTPEELRGCITYANGIDPRVQMTSPNADLWGRVIGHKTAAEVVAAIQVYYERPRINGREHPTIDPSTIKRIIAEETTRNEAHQSAQKAIPAKHASPNSYRQRNPEQWDAMFKQGAEDHKTQMRSRGLTPHTEACPDCRSRVSKTVTTTQLVAA